VRVAVSGRDHWRACGLRLEQDKTETLADVRPPLRQPEGGRKPDPRTIWRTMTCTALANPCATDGGERVRTKSQPACCEAYASYGWLRRSARPVLVTFRYYSGT
jgi:hypothetical protein